MEKNDLSPFTTVALKAMKDGNCVDLIYHGERRLVEIHAVGVSKAGKPCVRVYQVVGGSVFSEKTGWKMLTVADIEDFKEVNERSQAPRLGYRPDDAGMRAILGQVSDEPAIE